MMNPFSLEGKTILVTGAASGMGRATALAAAGLGARVIATDINEKGLAEILKLLEGDSHSLITADLTNEDDVRNLVESSPVLNGLALCAGIARMCPFKLLEKEEMDKVFSINFFGPVVLTQKLVKASKIASGGSIVFISSVDGNRIVHSGNSAYAASKGAIASMAKNMAIDLSPKKIRVNCILPATTDTPLIHTPNVTQEDLDNIVKQFPLKRLGKPEDIADGIIYLLSDASSWVTGTDLVIDGGYTLQ